MADGTWRRESISSMDTCSSSDIESLVSSQETKVSGAGEPAVAPPLPQTEKKVFQGKPTSQDSSKEPTTRGATGTSQSTPAAAAQKINKDTAGTSHSTPVIAADIKPSSSRDANTRSAVGNSHSTPAAAENNPSKGKSKKKSSGVTAKGQYHKALFILNKIAENEKTGTAHERDAEDRIKYQAIVEEYHKRSVMKEKKDTPAAASKRNRSLDDAGGDAKRSRDQKPTGPVASTSGLQPGRPFSEVLKDQLKVALVDEKSTGGRFSPATWTSIEAKLSEMVVEHILSGQGGPVPCFDSSEVVRGCRVVQCEDQFSKEFLEACVAKISDAWDGLKIKLISPSEIPRRPRARIWLPRIKMEPAKILQVLKLQNPSIPMEDWAVVKAEEPQANSTSLLLLISEESLPALEREQYRVRFGIRHAKLKVFKSINPVDPEDPALLLEVLKLTEGQVEGGTRSDEGGADQPSAL